MSRTRSISEVIKGTEHDKLLAVADKSRKWKRKKITLPPPIGHQLAVIMGEESYFVDNIDITGKHTVIHIDKTHMEVLPFNVESVDQTQNRLKVYYKNNTEIEVIRIS